MRRLGVAVCAVAFSLGWASGCLELSVQPGNACGEGEVLDPDVKDCTRLVCQGGQLVAEADPTQIPDDGNPCTIDVCEGVNPKHTKQDGVACTLGESEGTCKKGQCSISCQNDIDCDDTNPCTDDVCEDSKCKFIANDNVKPDDKNECTDDSCTGGVELHLAVSKDMVCLTTGKCDSLGNCVGCTSDDQCGLGDECNDRKCDKTEGGGTCVTVFKMNGPTFTQNIGDCKVRECKDGMVVNVTPQVDDIPNDGNPCTQDSCNGATPASSPEVEGYACGDNNACDGAGSCVDCAGGVGCGGNETCDNTAYACEKCTDGKKNNGESDVDCGGTKCSKCNQGMTCAKNEDCASSSCADGVCCDKLCEGICFACNQAGNWGKCLALPKFTDDNNPDCSGNKTCNGFGSCRLDNGQACFANIDCASYNCTLVGVNMACQP